MNIEKPFHYNDGDEKRESSHRPDAWYVEDAHVNIFDVTVGAFKDSRDKEAWVTSRRSKLGQYRELTSKLKDDVTVNIVQFDVAGRVGPETAAIMDKIGVKRHVLTNIQLMILSLNSWLYRNAIQRAAQARDDGRGIEARLWAERLVAEYEAYMVTLVMSKLHNKYPQDSQCMLLQRRTSPCLRRRAPQFPPSGRH